MKDNIVEVNFNSQYKEILNVLEFAKNKISEAKQVSSFMMTVKVDGQYLRFSSPIENAMEIIAHIELTKHDLLNRMSCREE